MTQETPKVGDRVFVIPRGLIEWGNKSANRNRKLYPKLVRLVGAVGKGWIRTRSEEVYYEWFFTLDEVKTALKERIASRQASLELECDRLKQLEREVLELKEYE